MNRVSGTGAFCPSVLCTTIARRTVFPKDFPGKRQNPFVCTPLLLAALFNSGPHAEKTGRDCRPFAIALSACYEVSADRKAKPMSRLFTQQMKAQPLSWRGGKSKYALETLRYCMHLVCQEHKSAVLQLPLSEEMPREAREKLMKVALYYAPHYILIAALFVSTSESSRCSKFTLLVFKACMTDSSTQM